MADSTTSPSLGDAEFRAPADLVEIASRGCCRLSDIINLVQATIARSAIDDGNVIACASMLEAAHDINNAISTLLCGDADTIESAAEYRRAMFGYVVAKALEAQEKKS